MGNVHSNQKNPNFSFVRLDRAQLQLSAVLEAIGFCFQPVLTVERSASIVGCKHIHPFN